MKRVLVLICLLPIICFAEPDGSIGVIFDGKMDGIWSEYYGTYISVAGWSAAGKSEMEFAINLGRGLDYGRVKTYGVIGLHEKWNRRSDQWRLGMGIALSYHRYGLAGHVKYMIYRDDNFAGIGIGLYIK